MPAVRPEPNHDPIGLFLHYLMAECGVSPNTLAAYRSDIVRFRTWRKTEAPGPLPLLDVADLARYVDHLDAVRPGATERGEAPGDVVDVLPLLDLRRAADRERGPDSRRPLGLGPHPHGARAGRRRPPAGCSRSLDAAGAS